MLILYNNHQLDMKILKKIKHIKINKKLKIIINIAPLKINIIIFRLTLIKQKVKIFL